MIGHMSACSHKRTDTMKSHFNALPAESLHRISDETAGLDAVIVLHSTTLGPAAGGCRLWTYQDASGMAHDACRLAEGMTTRTRLQAFLSAAARAWSGSPKASSTGARYSKRSGGPSQI
jgi:leucine dehydrogenase|tara:strand:+ start:985 stop:1341 length:357 start_codon:yes stop_codon:yes gene_type:complete